MNKNIYLYTKVNWGDYTKVKQNRFLRQKLLLEIKDILMKWSIYQDDVMIINQYVPNNRVSKYIKQN